MSIKIVGSIHYSIHKYFQTNVIKIIHMTGTKRVNNLFRSCDYRLHVFKTNSYNTVYHIKNLTEQISLVRKTLPNKHFCLHKHINPDFLRGKPCIRTNDYLFICMHLKIDEMI